MSPTKKAKAAPNPNPCGLSTREVEIAILAWKCLEEDGKINKQKLADLAHIGQAESAGRMWRGIKAKITAATEPSDNNNNNSSSSSSSGAGPATTTGTPAIPKGGGIAVAAADPASPSLIASQKKKAAAGAGKVAGRKRTKKEADGGGSGDGKKSNGEAGGGRRAAKRPKGFAALTLKTAQDYPSEMDAGEA